MDYDQLEIAKRSAYEAALLAENEWYGELRRVYPDAMPDARYDAKRNQATAELKALYEARHHATEAWLALGKIIRKEIAA